MSYILSNLCPVKEISPHLYIKVIAWFLILNDTWSDDGLNGRPKLVMTELLIVLLHDGVFNK